MIFWKRIVIAQHERGLLFRERSFETILEPGIHWIPRKRTQVEIYDLTVPEFQHARADFLLKDARGTVEKYLQVVETSDREVGVVYKNGKVAGVIAPGKRQLYWRGPIEVRIVKQDISKEFELLPDLAKVLARTKLDASVA